MINSTWLAESSAWPTSWLAKRAARVASLLVDYVGSADPNSLSLVGRALNSANELVGRDRCSDSKACWSVCCVQRLLSHLTLLVEEIQLVGRQFCSASEVWLAELQPINISSWPIELFGHKLRCPRVFTSQTSYHA